MKPFSPLREGDTIVTLREPRELGPPDSFSPLREGDTIVTEETGLETATHPSFSPLREGDTIVTASQPSQSTSFTFSNARAFPADRKTASPGRKTARITKCRRNSSHIRTPRNVPAR